VISVKTQVYVWPQAGRQVRSQVGRQVWEQVEQRVGRQVGPLLFHVWPCIDEGTSRD